MVVAVAVIVAVLLGSQPDPVATPATPTAAPAEHSERPAAPVSASEPEPSGPLAESRPASLEIPSIGVRTGEVIDLGLEPDGALEVPTDAATAGWYVESPTPGEVGPSIIAGHVDYANVPGVFYRLHELQPGEQLTVHREDGTSVVYTVDRVERYAKAEFPTEEVYGNTDGPELRLITCGGAFDDSTGHYLDNVIAYATMAGVK
ncbi:class F sortase [Prauserella sp. ASG 168]|uniref:Class F sortase n=1 Tax=Prauserella cavernicola TaxID=2800127 RepID=A0A934V212_9PSEU|nr:class F sortase [Prauserella cavernicola]